MAGEPRTLVLRRFRVGDSEEGAAASIGAGVPLPLVDRRLGLGEAVGCRVSAAARRSVRGDVIGELEAARSVAPAAWGKVI